MFIIASAGEHKCDACINKFHNCYLSGVTDKKEKTFLMLLQDIKRFSAGNMRNLYTRYFRHISAA